MSQDQQRRQAATDLQLLLWRIEADPALAMPLAAALCRASTADPPAQVGIELGPPLDPALVRDLLPAELIELVRRVVRSGWTPSDLAQVLSRRRTRDHLPLLAGLLDAETNRHEETKIASAWRAELAALGPTAQPDLSTPSGLALALGLGALLSSLPPISQVMPPPGADVNPMIKLGGDHGQRLAKVRALLAKAESTEFAEEAEALSAKAQEIISRYALEHLLDEPDDAVHGPAGVEARRIWIDPPYVFPKALLVNAVARANRCRSVVSEKIGFSTVLGSSYDLAAVELLATSLLVQANRAMLAHGRQAGWGGTSRTAPFRRSFLVAYATRISERLNAASDHAVSKTGRAGELVPVLRDHEQRVETAQQQMFPQLRQRQTNVHDRRGWVLGRAAADQARLDVRSAVTRAG